MGLFSFFKKILGALFVATLYVAFSVIGQPVLGAAIIKKGLLVFGSTLLLSAFAGRRPNLDLPDVSQSVYGTNEPAKTVYGEAVVGGLICSVTEIESPSAISGGNNYRNYVCRYAICDKKDGFDYEVVDVEIGGVWLQGVSEPFKPAAGGVIRTLGSNGTGDAFGDGFKHMKPYAESDYLNYLEVITGIGAISGEGACSASLMDCDDEETEWTGEGLVWAVVNFTTGAAVDTFRRNRVSANTVRFRVKAYPTGKTVSNPAEILKLHLKNELGLADARIDDPSFTATAALATARNYSVDGVMRAGQEYAAIQWILQTMDGAALIQDGGKFYLKGLGNPSSVHTITESMLIEEPEIEHSIAWRERYNHARAEIVDSESNWTRQSTAEIDDPGAFSEDGNLKFLLDLGGLNFVNTKARANRILAEELVRRRHGRSVNLTVHHSDVPGLKAYDNVTLNLETNGVTGVWRVLNVLHSIEGTVALTLTSEEGLAAVTTRFTTVPAVSGLTARATGTSSVILNWTRGTDKLVTGYEYRQKPSSSSAWNAWALVPNGEWIQNFTYIDGLSSGTSYDFQIRARKGTSVGVGSSTVSVTTRASIPDVTGLTVTIGSSGNVEIRITGTPPRGHRWEYRYRVSGGAFGAWTEGNDFTRTAEIPGSSFTRGSTYNFEVRAADRDARGNTATANLTYNVAPPVPTLTVPGAPTSVQVTFFLHSYRLTWLPPSSGGAVVSYEVGGHESATATSPRLAWSTVSGGAAARHASLGLPFRSFFVRARNSQGAGPSVKVTRTG